jgi:p-aminobenzoyl-glutamate transporter AbgT
VAFKEIAFFLLVIVAWFVLNRWVLPRFGVAT